MKTIESIESITDSVGEFATVAPGTVGVAVSQEDFRLPVLDLYRDIHKGIRAELFAVTLQAGSIDPSDSCDWAAIADHVAAMAHVLTVHAEHEDTFVEPVLADLRPLLAERIEADHVVLDSRFARIAELSTIGEPSPVADRRTIAHLLYLELSLFTSDYLRHQMVEERVVMPTLESELGFDEILGLHQSILAAIDPADMAQSQAFMLPAMNVDDRTEMLGGIKASAPPVAFAHVVDLARSVLDPSEFAKLAGRLGV